MRPFFFLLMLLTAAACWAQPATLSLNQAIEMAKANNYSLQSAAYEVDAQQKLKKTGFDLPKANAMLMYGQYNSYRNDNNVTLTQTIPFTALGSQAALNRSLLTASQLKKAVTENELIYQVKQTYYLLAYTNERRTILLQQDSLYEGFLRSASYRYKAGEGKLLEQATAETQRNETRNQLMQNQADITMLHTQLQTLLGVRVLPGLSTVTLAEIELTVLPDSSAIRSNPVLAFQRQQVDVAWHRKKLEKAAFAPDLLVGYFNQSLIDVVHPDNGTLATRGTRFSGVQVGIALPLWFAPYQARVQAAAARQKSMQSAYAYEQTLLVSQLEQAAQRFTKSKNSLAYYKDSALPNAALILRQAQTAFREGDIDFTEYLLSVKNALAIREGYLLTLHEYNQSIIHIDYLSGNK